MAICAVNINVIYVIVGEFVKRYIDHASALWCYRFASTEMRVSNRIGKSVTIICKFLGAF